MEAYTLAPDESVCRERQAEADKIVNHHALAAGGLGLVPVPFLDMALIAGAQLNMLRRLSGLYGVRFSAQLGKSAIATLVGGGLPVASFSLLKLIPGLGSLLGGVSYPAVAGAATYGIGKVFIQHFESGGTFLNFDPVQVRSYYRQQLAQHQSARPAGAAGAADIANNVGGAANNVGGAANNVGGAANNVGGAVNNAGGAANNVGGAANNVGDTANNVGGAANNVGDTANNVGGAANNVGDTVNKAGDAANNVGDTAHKAGEAANDVGDTVNKAGDAANNVGDVAHKAGEAAVHADELASKANDAAGNTDVGAFAVGSGSSSAEPTAVPLGSAALEGSPIILVSVRFLGQIKGSQSDEFVELRNASPLPVDISGWCLYSDAPGQSFVFPAGTVIAPATRVRVYTGLESPEPNSFSFHSKRALWNDKGDLAILADASGHVVAKHGYGDRETRTLASITAAFGVPDLKIVYYPEQLVAQKKYRGKVDFLTAVEDALRCLLEDSGEGNAPLAAATKLRSTWAGAPSDLSKRPLAERLHAYLNTQTLALVHPELQSDGETPVHEHWMFHLTPGLGAQHLILVSRANTQPTHQKFS